MAHFIVAETAMVFFKVTRKNEPDVAKEKRTLKQKGTVNGHKTYILLHCCGYR